MRLGFFALAMIAAAACTFTLPEVQVSAPVDAGPLLDAAAPDADAAPPPFCASANPKHAFCKDFDDGALGGGWSFPLPPAGTPAVVVELASDLFVSPKYAARFGVHGTTDSLPPDDTTAGAGWELSTKGATALHLAFAMRMERLEKADQFIVLYIGTGTADLRNEVTGVDGTATTITSYPESLTDAGSGFPTVWSAAPNVGDWTTVTVDFTVSPSAHYTIKLVDPSGTEKTAADSDLEGEWAGDAPGFAIGMPYIAGHAHDKSIVVDNIAFDVDHP